MENPQGFDRQLWGFRAALAGAAIVGVLLVLATTSPHGPWATWDSVVYADVARHIARGDGILASNLGGDVEFVFAWPPLFPLLMSPLVALGMEPGEAGRWLNALAHGALAVLVGLCVLRITGQRAAAAAVAWLSALSTVFLLNATTLWSEPLFFTIFAGGLLCLLEWSVRRRWPWLVAGGALLGLACLQRYAGYAFLAAGVIWLMQLRGPWRERLRNTGLFMLAAAPLPLLWRVCMLVFADRVDARTTIEFAWPDRDHFHVVGVALSGWLFPAGWPKFMRIVLAALSGAAAVSGVGYAVRLRLWREEEKPFETMLAVFALCYVGVVATTILFLDHPLQADDRLLSPVLLLGLIALVWLGFAQTGRRRVVACSLLVLLGVGYAARDVSVVTRTTDKRAEYLDNRRADSPLLAAVSSLPEDTPLASNERLVISYFTGRPVAEVPLTKRVGLLAPEFQDLPAARAELVRKLADGDGYVAWFSGDGASDLPAELAGLRVVGKYEDGVLLAAGDR